MVEPTIEEDIVSCLAIAQQDDPKVPSIHLIDLRPASDAPVRLDLLAYGIAYRALKPLVENGSTVRTLSNLDKVSGELHPGTVSKRRMHSCNYRMGDPVLQAADQCHLEPDALEREPRARDCVDSSLH
jgi:hypothetical protein